LIEIKKREFMEKELEIAQSIQTSFLPKEQKDFGGVSVAAYFEPAKFVAGDLYDVTQLGPDKTGILIADVAGKGVSASLVMAQAISLFRMLVRQSPSGQQTLTQLNQELYGRLGGRFITALYLILDRPSMQVSVTSAGHGPVLVCRAANQKVEEVILSGNVPLGLMKDVVYADTNFHLDPKDKVIVFSDGLPEARDKKDRQFELPNIYKIILQNGLKSDQDMVSALKDAVKKFSYPKDLYDDLTIIVFSIKP
jgi:sigma-B regulation protein RsbU (phosphoserine phosphatase)